jgi:hypothetical protein
MKMNITKGKWIATTDFINVCSEETGLVIACLDSEGSPDIDADESLANAQLMASAPEMYEALRMFLQINPTCHHGVTSCGDCAVCLGQKALAKAEGEA